MLQFSATPATDSRPVLERQDARVRDRLDDVRRVFVATILAARSRSRPRESADLTGTLIHEYAHTLLHFDVEDISERSKREVEAEAVAYVVGRYFELDMSESTFYPAAWNGDDAEVITERLSRISNTAQELIDTLGLPVGRE